MCSSDLADITINPDAIIAKYRITNTGTAPAALTLTLPLPDLDYSDPDVSYAIPASDPVNFIGLNTKTDNQSGGFGFAQSALQDGRNITQTLRHARLSLVPVGTFFNQITAMAPDQRQRLADARLIMQFGTDQQGNPVYQPNWVVRTIASKKHTLEPGKSATIELRYRTSVGTRLDTALRLPLRHERGVAEQVQKLRANYCIDDAFYVGIDKLGAPPPAPARLAPTLTAPVPDRKSTRLNSSH